MKHASTEPFIASLELVRDRVPDFSRYPFCIPAVRNLHSLQFNPQVTFFVGENGTGTDQMLAELTGEDESRQEG